MLLVGCSDDGGGSDTAGSDGDASQNAESSSDGGCGVVTEDEVADATGVEVAGAAELPTGCSWSVSGSDSGGSYEWQAVGVEAYQSNLDAAESMSSFEIVTVSGLGDEAFQRNQVGGTGDVLAYEVWVRTGDEAFFVRSVALPASDEVLAAEEALAQLLVDRV